MTNIQTERDKSTMKNYLRALRPLPLWRLSKNDIIHIVVAAIILVVSILTEQVWVVALSPVATVIWGPPARWSSANPAFPKWHDRKEKELLEKSSHSQH